MTITASGRSVRILPSVSVKARDLGLQSDRSLACGEGPGR